MPAKPYKIQEDAPITAAEPAEAYLTANTDVSVSGKWNPNVPFHGTQEEWWEHFHRIEEGEFYPVAEVHQRILHLLSRMSPPCLHYSYVCPYVTSFRPKYMERQRNVRSGEICMVYKLFSM